MDLDLLDAEIAVLQMLAGQKPIVWNVEAAICAEALGRRGFCTCHSAPQITAAGVAALEAATGTIDWRSRISG